MLAWRQERAQAGAQEAALWRVIACQAQSIPLVYTTSRMKAHKRHITLGSQLKLGLHFSPSTRSIQPRGITLQVP
jgi:hypothetical protein